MYHFQLAGREESIDEYEESIDEYMVAIALHNADTQTGLAIRGGSIYVHGLQRLHDCLTPPARRSFPPGEV
jgi:hypothetical protein